MAWQSSVMRMLPALAVISCLLAAPGCSLPGGGDQPTPATPPMIGAAGSSEGGVMRRAKYRSSHEVANSRKELLASASAEAGADAESAATPSPETLIASTTAPETAAGAPGSHYPHTAPQLASAPPLFPMTQRLPDVRNVSYEAQP